MFTFEICQTCTDKIKRCVWSGRVLPLFSSSFLNIYCAKNTFSMWEKRSVCVSGRVLSSPLPPRPPLNNQYAKNTSFMWENEVCVCVCVSPHQTPLQSPPLFGVDRVLPLRRPIALPPSQRRKKNGDVTTEEDFWSSSEVSLGRRGR